MRCGKCEKEYPSNYYFVTESLCRTCFEGLLEKDREQILKEIESRTTEGSGRRSVNGHELSCPVCGHGEFWKRKTLMNTPGLTFFGVEWANKQAENFVCNSCSHVLWFLLEAEG